MFENLSQKLTTTLRKVRGQGRLTETNIDDSLKEVKMALLEADVNFRVVKAFLKSVKSRAIGEEVQSSLTPGQKFIKIVNDELTNMMGASNESLATSEDGATVVMVVGLQGAGKTSSVGKLANYHAQKGFSPYLVPADVYRPAAIDQLRILAESMRLPCHPSTNDQNPIEIAAAAVEVAKASNRDLVLIDTAGRLHIDSQLMDELHQMRQRVNPKEILFVADAMTGQDAVNTAKSFNDKLDLTGVLLTKMDGDARGGAALSIRAVTQKPIKFIAVGEKLENLEAFHPERIASRILGMGDMLSLIEKVEDNYSQTQAIEIQDKFRRNEFTLDDFRDQLRTMRRMGSMKELMGMLPGVDSNLLKNAKVDEKQFNRIDAIISSMTRDERQNHNLLNGSRRQRIAIGSGVAVNDVNRLMKQFTQMRKMMSKLSKTQDPRKAMQMMRNMMPPQSRSFM
ncbi:MAG: signal recognition particle protein [SAR324 cluster bacterium]|uniref:Signal recognition particle protein n=1 Tax=SAR324 cluster bacterium TaxID=2024889 RepID=A0A2D6YMD1_9DELT|nr:signal recognition particle protein [SAR324 cluster bacterium]